jgi:hypothetical protein
VVHLIVFTLGYLLGGVTALLILGLTVAARPQQWGPPPPQRGGGGGGGPPPPALHRVTRVNNDCRPANSQSAVEHGVYFDVFPRSAKRATLRWIASPGWSRRAKRIMEAARRAGENKRADQRRS